MPLQPSRPEQSDPPQTRQMPVGIAAMIKANSEMICSATGESVRKVSIARLLEQPLEIPIFQRRYCWSEDQWKILLGDVTLLAKGVKDVHQLGRLTCAIKNDSDRQNRVLVIDGQQRNTTTLLLLAAIRDVAASRALNAVSTEQAAATLASRLDRVLFPDTEGLESWLASRCDACNGALTVQEGEALRFASLLPTYCDRAAYFAATLPPRAKATGGGEWHRPLEAKKFFKEQVQQLTVEDLAGLADAILGKLEWLFFPIDLSRDLKDGTDNLQVIFERLALREKTVVAPPQRKAEAANMGAADFVRNLLLGSFRDESLAIDMYKHRWLPIERAASAAAERRRTSDVAAALEEMLESFLAAQPEKPTVKSVHPWSPIGGMLYARFRQWLVVALADGGSDSGQGEAGRPPSATAAHLDNSAEVERRTVELLGRLQAFALDDFANDKGKLSESQPAPASPLAVAAAKARLPRAIARQACKAWRCRQCAFSNPAESSVCTACLLARPSA